MKILCLIVKGKKLKVEPMYSMLIKRLAKYGYNDCEVRFIAGNYAVFVKDNTGKITQVGTARKTPDNKYVFERLNLK